MLIIVSRKKEKESYHYHHHHHHHCRCFGHSNHSYGIFWRIFFQFCYTCVCLCARAYHLFIRNFFFWLIICILFVCYQRPMCVCVCHQFFFCFFFWRRKETKIYARTICCHYNAWWWSYWLAIGSWKLIIKKNKKNFLRWNNFLISKLSIHKWDFHFPLYSLLLLLTYGQNTGYFFCF